MKVKYDPKGPVANKIGVRLSTKRKFERIAKMNRWTMVEAADAAADHYLANASPICDRPGERAREPQSA